jgi:3D (Asp-Asp-Asp) domain-containing protein
MTGPIVVANPISLTDQAGNEVDVTTNGEMKVETVPAAGSTQNCKIEGDVTGNIAEVNASGELKVIAAQPTPPPATTAVRVVEKGSISGTVDNFYTITNTKTLSIQRLSGGAESSNSGHIIELFEDASGTGTPLVAIEDIYVNGQSGQKDLLGDYVGDGTRRILLRRRAFGGGASEVTAIWQGYEG